MPSSGCSVLHRVNLNKKTNTRAFNKSRATQTEALDISKAFNKVWNDGLFHKLKSYRILVWIFHLFYHFSVIHGRVIMDRTAFT